jgi:hypothetical protein
MRTWNGFGIERPAGSLKIQKPSSSAKTGNEGILRSQRKQIARTGLILLFDGEVSPAKAEPRRAQANRYPDSELRASLPPSRH